MRFSAAFLLVAGLLLFPEPGRGDEPPHLEFVRGLRAQGMADLALEYLLKLRQNPPPGLADELPLEIARARLDVAAQETDPMRRSAAQLQARADFQAYIAAHPKDPRTAEAAVDLARILALEGKAQLNRASKQATKEGQQAATLAARIQFEEAGKQLQAAVAAIHAGLAVLAKGTSAADRSAREALQDARLRAELEIGINLLDQVQTYTEEAELPRRGELLKQAISSLDKTSRRDAKNPLCWQAYAWLGRCQQVNEDPKAARKIYADILAEPGEHAEAAKRLARYFRMRALETDRDLKNALGEAQRAGEEWLQLYPTFAPAPEGLGVRFELAQLYWKQARTSPKNSGRQRDFYDRALKLFQGLEQPENDYTADAHDARLQIILAVSSERSKGDISKLKDFTECYLRAQVEIAQMSEAAKKGEAGSSDEERKKHFDALIESLTRAVDFADAKTPVEELNDARYLLTYGYLATDDLYRAAVEGEELARNQPRSPRAPLAAAYALRAYAMLLGRRERTGAEDLEVERGRLRSLAQFVEQHWPALPAADTARHMVGLALLSEKNYAEAIDVLERVTPSYSEAMRAYTQLAAAALKAQKEEPKPAPGKPPFDQRAIQALARIPELPAGAPAYLVGEYVAARRMLADIYYRAKRYDDMERLAEALVKRLETVDEKSRAEHRTNALSLVLYAKQGKAEAEFEAGHYAKVRELLDPLVKSLKAPAQAAALGDLKEKHGPLLRALLVLAMRASIQENQIEQGKELLDLLQKTFPENSQEILVQLVRQLKEQIGLLRQQGESSKAQLEKTVANFSTFLDELTRQQEKSARPEMLLFLAQSYSSLDQHGKAADLAAKFTEPPPAAGAKEADERLVQLYRASRILVVRELRLNKDFDKAELILKEVAAAPWGQHNLEVKKEEILLLEDQEKYLGKTGAIQRWNALMQQLQPKLQDNKVREQYFDCYYHFTVCLYRNALKIPDVSRRDQNVRRAATYIVKLETKDDTAAETAKKRFEELLAQEEPLRRQYDELKKEAAK